MKARREEVWWRIMEVAFFLVCLIGIAVGVKILIWLW